MTRMIRGSFFRQTEGYFTIEANLLFPLLLFMTLILLFCSLFFYHYAVLYYKTFTTAERISYEWHHSADDLSGAHGLGGLDDMLQHHPVWHLFSRSSGQSLSVQLPVQPDGHQGYGVRRKLQASARSVSQDIRGSLSYVYRLLDSRIRVELLPTVRLPQFTSFVINDSLSTSGSSIIVNPAEFIRTVELIDTYLNKLLSAGVSKQEAGDALDEFFQMRERPDITSHQEAFVYLQQLVDGDELHMDTSHGVRMIDAFDRQGIAHQAYYTFNRASLSPQLAKDAELLADGKAVKGVVWHFFKEGPAPSLRQEIEDKGIVIVVHD